MAKTQDQNKNLLLMAGIVVVLIIVMAAAVYLMGGRVYFTKTKDESVVKSTFGEIDLSDCSEGQVLKKTSTGWRCDIDDDRTVIGGGWDKDYDRSCSSCFTCGVYWGQGKCTATTGQNAVFQCSRGTKRKIAEYGVTEQKTYWYQCIN